MVAETIRHQKAIMLPAVTAYYKSLVTAVHSETSRTTKWLLRRLHEALSQVWNYPIQGGRRYQPWDLKDMYGPWENQATFGMVHQFSVWSQNPIPFLYNSEEVQSTSSSSSSLTASLSQGTSSSRTASLSREGTSSSQTASLPHSLEKECLAH